MWWPASLNTETSGAATSTYSTVTGTWTATGEVTDINSFTSRTNVHPGARLQQQLYDRRQCQCGRIEGGHRAV